MANVGKSVKRVDSYDKVTGRAKYTDDICERNALVVKIVYSTITHGYVKKFDTEEAEKVDGVVKIFTCFDVPDICFPTAGHPWSLDPDHQDTADRKLLNTHVRYYGDEVAVVVANDIVAADRAARLVKIEYEELPFVLDPIKAMEEGQPQIHEEFKNNILKHTSIRLGNYEEAKKEEGLICVDKWYFTPTVQHCHIENHVVFAYGEGGRTTVVSSTQIPHIVRRTIGQALGKPWGNYRVIKPYIGGGFGNKQDTLYEPLAAWISEELGGRLVKIDVPREATFVSNRVRHAIKFHIISYLRKDGTYVARKLEMFSDQGAYASHGHSVTAKGAGVFAQMYPCKNVEVDAYTIYTNKSAAGAMRGYGIPQAMFAFECHTDDVARRVKMEPLKFRRKNIMPVGYKDESSGNVNYYDTYNQCMNRAIKIMDYHRKRREYKNQSGEIRKGIGLACLWYNTGVYPISLEHSSCRMVLNQDGSIQLQVGETEIGQGADTAYAQMGADAVGIRDYKDVHVISSQDTDITPFGLGAYASRQTYMCGFSISEAGKILKNRILSYAEEMSGINKENLDVIDSEIIDKNERKKLFTLAELATTAFYSLKHSVHITAEASFQIHSNAYSFGASVAEIEVDIPLCKIKLVKIANVHDCGRLINPALAEAQVHGGMSMGIGYGLLETLLYDEKTGRPLNNNLLDYKLSTIMDHPHLECDFIENPEPTSPYGTKSLGEPPVPPVAPAIRNALLNATGIEVDSIPLNQHILFTKFCEEGLICTT